MHLKSMKVFCDVVVRRSFSKAAEDNGITQSGASQMVNQLEQRVGLKLIDRSKRPFVLTEEGQVYYDGCRKLVREYYALEDRVRLLHQDVDGRVGIASIYSVGLSHIDRFVKIFSQRYPKAKVHVEYKHPSQVYELVETDQVDLGLVSYPKSSRAISCMDWREESMVLACAPGNPLASCDSIRLADLNGQKMVGFVTDLKIRREVDRALVAHGAEVTVAMEFDNIETLKRAIEIDAGISLLPKPTIEREVASGSLVSVPLEGESLVRPVGIIHRHGKELGTTAQRFIQFLQEDEQALGNGNGNGKHTDKNGGIV